MSIVIAGLLAAIGLYTLSWHVGHKHCLANDTVERKTTTIGEFDTIEEAAAARKVFVEKRYFQAAEEMGVKIECPCSDEEKQSASRVIWRMGNHQINSMLQQYEYCTLNSACFCLIGASARNYAK